MAKPLQFRPARLFFVGFISSSPSVLSGVFALEQRPHPDPVPGSNHEPKELTDGTDEDRAAAKAQALQQLKNNGEGDGSNVWYFAYGANLDQSVLEERRGIHPAHTARGVLKGWGLLFNFLGGYGNVVQGAVDADHPDVHGVLLQINQDDLLKLAGIEWNYEMVGRRDQRIDVSVKVNVVLLIRVQVKVEVYSVVFSSAGPGQGRGIQRRQGACPTLDRPRSCSGQGLSDNFNNYEVGTLDFQTMCSSYVSCRTNYSHPP